jgi:heptosyltransferase-2
VWIRLPNWVGDIVMATPVLRAVRQAWPAARIAWCGRPVAQAILGASPWHDAFLLHRARSGFGGFMGAIRAARAFAPDCAIVLPHSFGTALLARATGAATRVGYLTEQRGFLLTQGLPRPTEGGRTRPEYMADHWAKLVALLGVEVADRAPSLVLADAARAQAAALLAAHPGGDGPLLLVNPGASYGPSKMWMAERFAAVAARVRASRGARIVVTTGPGEEAVADAVEAALPGPKLVFRGAALSLEACMALTERAAVLLTNDTGPRHFAVALGVRTVVLMGPTDPRYTATPAERGVVLRRDVPCGPCHETVCPLAGPEHHQCLRLIGEAEVAAAVEQAIDLAVAR